MADTSQNTNISLDASSLSGLLGPVGDMLQQMLSNFLGDPGLRNGISNFASEQINNLISGMGADFSTRGLPGMMSRMINGRDGNAMRDPTLATIGNMLSMNPIVQKMLGVADPRIYQGVVNQLAKQPYGIMGSPKQYIDTLMINERMNSEITRLLDSDSPFKRGLNQAHLSLGYRNLAARGALSAEELRKGIPKEVSDSMMQTLWIGKTMLNMGDNVDGIMATAGILGGGGTGNKFKESMKTFQQYMKDLIASGVESYEEIQAITQQGIQQIQSLQAAGFDAGSAASMARSASIGAARTVHKLRAEGQEADMNVIANIRTSQKAFFREDDEGFKMAAGLKAIEVAQARGGMSEQEAEAARANFLRTGQLPEEIRRHQAVVLNTFNERRGKLKLNAKSQAAIENKEREWTKKQLIAEWSGLNSGNLPEGWNRWSDKEKIKYMSDIGDDPVAQSIMAAEDEQATIASRAKFEKSLEHLAGTQKNKIGIVGEMNDEMKKKLGIFQSNTGTEENRSEQARLYYLAKESGIDLEGIREQAKKTGYKGLVEMQLGGEKVFFDPNKERGEDMSRVSKDALEKYKKEQEEKAAKDNPLVAILQEIRNLIRGEVDSKKTKETATNQNAMTAKEKAEAADNSNQSNGTK